MATINPQSLIGKTIVIYDRIGNLHSYVTVESVNYYEKRKGYELCGHRGTLFLDSEDFETLLTNGGLELKSQKTGYVNYEYMIM